MALENFTPNISGIKANPNRLQASLESRETRLFRPRGVGLPRELYAASSGEVRVWRVDHCPGRGGSHAERCEADARRTLTDADVEEFAHINHTGLRARSLSTRSMLRRALSEFAEGEVHWSEWAFERDRFGRPGLKAGFPDIDFSCSHTPWTSLIALSRAGRVGIDVESCRCGYEEELVSGFLSFRERRQLRSLPEASRQEAFARLWTLKEAYLKAVGGSLTEEIVNVEFDAISDRAIIEAVAGAPDGLKLAVWQVASSGGRLMAALATSEA